jgi:hypothetical protein
MSPAILSFVTTRRATRLTLPIAVLAALALAFPVVSQATVLAPWGSSLSATPTLDTANGASAETNDEPLSSYSPGNNSDNAISTAFSSGCSRSYGAASINCTPWMHSGADNTVWNDAVAGGSASAPQGGQVLQVRIKGCAVKDPNSPTQSSPTGNGGSVSVNTIEFQTLTLLSGGSYRVDATAGLFTLPFCSDTPSGPNTISTYQPIHMCVSAGDTVGFYDVGGMVPNPTGPSFYPQGVPFQVIAPVAGSGTVSFTDADTVNGFYSYGAQPRGNNSGWGQEGNQELQLQVVEGVGDNAYGLCPGGDAEEPSNSNTILCVERHVNPGDPYGTCTRSGTPLYPPANTGVPTISGTAQEGQRLNESRGSWTNSPYGYQQQWEDCDSSGASCIPIPGAYQQYYYPTASDVGHTLVVQEWAINDANMEGPATSAPTAVVRAGSPPLPPPVGAPVIGSLRLNPASFNAARGTTITYTDNQSARAKLRVVQPEPGLMRGRTCVAPAKVKSSHARPCTRLVTVKTIVHADRGGANGVKLNGVPPGHYELMITATIHGRTGRPVIAPFTARQVSPRGHLARKRRAHMAGVA